MKSWGKQFISVFGAFFFFFGTTIVKGSDNHASGISDAKNTLIIVGSILGVLILAILIIIFSVARRKKGTAAIEMKTMGISRRPSMKKRKRLKDGFIPVVPTTHHRPPAPMPKSPSASTPSAGDPHPKSSTPSAVTPSSSVTPVDTPTSSPKSPPKIKISDPKHMPTSSKSSIKTSPAVADKREPVSTFSKKTTHPAFRNASENDL